MATETYLEDIAESVSHARWIVEHHVGKGEGRQRCVLCETWWPCDLVSLAATAVLLADRMVHGRCAGCQEYEPDPRAAQHYEYPP